MGRIIKNALAKIFGAPAAKRRRVLTPADKKREIAVAQQIVSEYRKGFEYLKNR